jgi:hypothetical protein
MINDEGVWGEREEAKAMVRERKRRSRQATATSRLENFLFLNSPSIHDVLFLHPLSSLSYSLWMNQAYIR